MYKSEEIEFETIYSPEVIEGKIDALMARSMLAGYTNPCSFKLHLKRAFGGSAAWLDDFHLMTITGKVRSGENGLTNVKISISMIRWEIIWLSVFFFAALCMFDFKKGALLVPALVFTLIGLLLVLFSIYRTRTIGKDISYYKGILLRAIIE